MRPLYEIAQEIYADWHNIWFGAVPYLHAMVSLNTMKDNYGSDSAREIVMYFLSNASNWRGENARKIKAELKRMLNA